MIGTTLGVLDVILRGAYVLIEIGLSECSTYVTNYFNVDGLFLGYLLGYVHTLKCGNNEGDKLGFPKGKYFAQNLEPFLDCISVYLMVQI